MTVNSGPVVVSGTTARRSLFTENPAAPPSVNKNEVPDDDEFDELMMTGGAVASTSTQVSKSAIEEMSNKKKRLKQSTLDDFPNDDEINDLFLDDPNQVNDPWLIGSNINNTQNTQKSENMDLQYPDSDDELEMMVTRSQSENEERVKKLTSTQRVDKGRGRGMKMDVSTIGVTGDGEGEPELDVHAERAHQRLMAVVRKVEDRKSQKVVKELPPDSTIVSFASRTADSTGDTKNCFFPISNTTENYFVRLCKEDDVTVPSWKKSNRSLLPTSFNELRLKAYEELQKQKSRDSKVASEVPSAVQSLLHEVKKKPPSASAKTAAPSDDSQGEGEFVEKSDAEKRRLWVEQYSPRSYLELLSEEFINRALLRWIKLWDKLVFKRDVPTNIVSADKLPTSLPTNAAAKKFLKDREHTQQQEINPTTGQPVFKVCMLCGAPGLGKTTLAHVLAKHAGYNVIEVNASDDRSPELFAKIIENATQMGGGGSIALGSKIEKNQTNANNRTNIEQDRPKCLIIDEIDGSPEASIKVLLNFVNGTQTAKKGSKKGKKTRILKRPIICICNDPYVPALRQLRQQALVLKFPVTSVSRLTSRLTFICRRENLRADKTSLMNLCELAANDIRSCINTLEFIKNKSDVVSTMTIKAAGVGRKNVKKGLYEVWGSIFTMPRAKRGPNDEQVATNANAAAFRFSETLNLVSMAGEYERQVSGIYDNYPDIPFRDASMFVPSVLSDWLLFYDVSYRYLMSHQTFSLMKFFPFVSVAAHLLCAVNRKPKIQFPTTLNDLRMSAQKSANLVQSVLLETSQRLVKHDTATRLVMETLPYLSRMIKPTLRPVNTLLYTEAERECLKYTMSIMISYGLMYRFVPESEIGERYILDPNIDTVINFTPEDAEKNKLSSDAAEIISREILKSKIRHSITTSDDVIKPTSQSAARKVNKRSAESLMGMDTSAMAAAKKCVTKTKVARDFFGRVIQTKTLAPKTQAEQEKSDLESENRKKESKLLVKSSKVWFKFQQGYSNAVKRNVKIGEFV